jgi:hypothetical protein
LSREKSWEKSWKVPDKKINIFKGLCMGGGILRKNDRGGVEREIL